jgi:hypothetical protein
MDFVRYNGIPCSVGAIFTVFGASSILKCYEIFSRSNSPKTAILCTLPVFCAGVIVNVVLGSQSSYFSDNVFFFSDEKEKFLDYMKNSKNTDVLRQLLGIPPNG